MKLYYYNADVLCTIIEPDYQRREIKVTDYAMHPLDRAFGNIKNPTFEDYEWFLEERCFPRTRDHLKDILKALGLDYYDPLSIILKTHGVMAGDNFHVEVEE